MKKFFSISLSLLMIVAMLHISVATHFCEGKEVATTVSLSGKLASCGMTYSKEEVPLQGTNLKNHCCDDIVTFCGISSNYAPSFSFLPDSYQYNFQVLATPGVIPANSQVNISHLYTNVSPPGAFMSTNVELSGICVFRI